MQKQTAFFTIWHEREDFFDLKQDILQKQVAKVKQCYVMFFAADFVLCVHAGYFDA